VRALRDKGLLHTDMCACMCTYTYTSNPKHQWRHINAPMIARIRINIFRTSEDSSECARVVSLLPTSSCITSDAWLRFMSASKLAGENAGLMARTVDT
jgi:hypothetical protein